ncbi:hypothetical protein EAG_04021 [Camponotus floridanus]|uniref:Uncharacterized protein n=1 Tax=Camponotus floridanus TaxID=104421 RepID=E2AUZ0_CAMFO|nr:hypothetical protein EAG_04021 [Camponotus floridanus]
MKHQEKPVCEEKDWGRKIDQRGAVDDIYWLDLRLAQTTDFTQCIEGGSRCDIYWLDLRLANHIKLCSRRIFCPTRLAASQLVFLCRRLRTWGLTQRTGIARCRANILASSKWRSPASPGPSGRGKGESERDRRRKKEREEKEETAFSPRKEERQGVEEVKRRGADLLATREAPSRERRLRKKNYKLGIEQREEISHRKDELRLSILSLPLSVGPRGSRADLSFTSEAPNEKQS